MTPDSECTLGCRSRQHGGQITAAIVRGTENQAVAYMKNLCQRFYSVTDATGKTALHTAASCGKRKVVKWLVSQGASLNQRDSESGYTPLHRALFYGHLDVACTLIQAGSSTSTLDNEGLTPFDHATSDATTTSVVLQASQGTHAYLWGTNANFNLGQISQHARHTPECADSFPWEGRRISKVALSKFHTLFLTGCGEVYTCGHGQGGRLGLKTDAPVITPRHIKSLSNTTVKEIASGTHHSLFLTDVGQVLSCGSNLYHQLGLSPAPEHVHTPKPITWHKDNKQAVMGISAAKYHSVVWTSDALYTFGLNAGQLGHFRNTNESTVVTPRYVSGIASSPHKTLACVGTSDGATVFATNDAVYVLHEYQVRKVVSKLPGVSKVACVGGHLDVRAGAKGLIENGGDDLKIAVLTKTTWMAPQHLYLWTQQWSHLSQCVFTLRRQITVSDFCLNSHCLGIVTSRGEAFSAVLSHVRMQKINEKTASSKSRWVCPSTTDTIATPSRVALRLARIPALHRTVSMACDPKGQNFAAIQADPNVSLSDLPQVSESSFAQDFSAFLDNACETDTIHDVLITCGKRKFIAHSFVLATHSLYFRRILLGKETEANATRTHNAWKVTNEPERKYFEFPDVQPEVLEQVLSFIYTGSLKVSNNANQPDGNLKDLNGNTSERELRSAAFKATEERKAAEKSKKRKGKASVAPSDLLQRILNLAKKLEIPEFEKRMRESQDAHDEGLDVPLLSSYCPSKYLRESLAELHDVTVISKTEEVVKAHKCVLAARLEYFNIMLGSRWMGAAASMEVISIPLPTSILTVILDFLYEDDSQKLRDSEDVEFVCNVLVAADQFLITRLRELCENAIARMVTLKNAGKLFEFAGRHNATGLKRSIMRFLCRNIVTVLENGTLISTVSQEKLRELSNYYRNFDERMSYRILTPHDAPPYDRDLERALDDHPFLPPDSENELDDPQLFKEKFQSGKSVPGSARRKKRQHRNSQGEGRLRKPSSSSSVCSSDGDQREAEELEDLSFDDLEERKQSPLGTDGKKEEEEKVDLIGNGSKDGEDEVTLSETCRKGDSSWQKVTRKKNTVTSSAPFKSPVTSPVKENGASDFSEPPPAPQVTHSSVTQSPSPPKFPSLQEALNTAQKASNSGRKSKIQKLSQKQRKRLVSESARGQSTPEKAKVPACPWGPSAQAWGTEAATEEASKDTSSLADIMMAEKRNEKKNTPHIRTQEKKNAAGTVNSNRPRSEEAPNSISNHREQESAPWSPVAPLPTSVNSMHVTPSKGHPACDVTKGDFASPSFTHILMEEETRSDNLLRELSKPLSVIQTEDRAMEELLAFYGAGECFEEHITVSRMRESVANPTWSKQQVSKVA